MQGRLDTAIADFTEAIRLDPKNAETYSNRGWAYNRKGDHDTAIADCTEAIRLDPKMADAYGDRGWAYNEKGDYDTAIADCSRGHPARSERRWAYTVRGWAYEGKGDRHAAVANLTEAIRPTPVMATFILFEGISTSRWAKGIWQIRILQRPRRWGTNLRGDEYWDRWSCGHLSAKRTERRSPFPS